MRAWLDERGKGDIDIVVEPQETQGKEPDVVAPWVDAGATWWIESRWGGEPPGARKMKQVSKRLEAGPPG